MADFTHTSDLAQQYIPHGWPGDTLDPGSPPERCDEPELPSDPPGDDEDPPPDTSEPPQEARVLVADQVLDPEALVPATSILARLESLPTVIAAKSRAAVLVHLANGYGRIISANDREKADALRDQLKAHAAQVEEFLGPLCDAANKLHKGATGIRSFCLGDVAIATKKLGDGIAASIRAEQEAEAARQRAAREKALADERARLKAEEEAAELERQRLDREADEAQRKGDQISAEVLRQAAADEQRNAEQARQEAISATAPPVAQQEIAKPSGASTRDNWQALPAHSESWDDLPLSDKRALIIFIGERLELDDGSFIHLVDVSKKACNQLAKAQQSTMKVPGIRAVNPPVYSKTSRG